MAPTGLENLKEIPGGRRGTAATIAEMKALVDQGKKQFDIITLASDIVHDERERDHVGEPRAILEWVQNSIRFVNDVYGVEVVQAARRTIQRGAGDCDDLSTLFNTLCAAIGYSCRFKTIKADPSMPGEFSHVYSQVEVDGKWISADPSQKGRPLGWEPPTHNGSQTWGYSTGVLRKVEDLPPSLKGLGMQALRFRDSIAQKTQIRGDIKQAAMNLVARFMGRKTAAAVPQQAAPVESPAPTVQQTPFEPVLDSEEHTYYNDTDGYGGGKYGQETYEDLQPTMEADTVVLPLPRVDPVEYSQYEGRRLDEKFKGRQRFVQRPPDLTAIKDGTPEVEEMW